MASENDMTSSVINIGNKDYQLIKRGKEQADQVILFTQWLTQYALPIFEKFSNPEGSTDLSYIDLLSLLLDKLSSEALVSLFSVLVGCSYKVAEKEFDIGILIEAATVVWDNQPGLQRVVKRFFSTQA